MTDQTTEVPASLAGPAAAAPPVPTVPATPAETAAAGQPVMLSQVAARIKRPQVIVPLYLDPEAASQIQDAEEALRRAIEYDETTNEADTAPALARHVRDLEDEAEASRQDFVLRALPHRTYQKLKAEHPPTEKQIEAAAARDDGSVAAFDPDSLAPALVAAQLLSPAIDDDPETFEAFWEDLSDGQMNELWSAAVAIQMGVTDPGPKSEIASRVLQSSGTR